MLWYSVVWMSFVGGLMGWKVIFGRRRQQSLSAFFYYVGVG